jgi:branched-chain amino acid transport system ATP-binding protein
VEFIDVQNLAKSFGGLRAVDGISLQVKQGELVSIIGPNGAGKSTLFNLMTGYIRPDTGAVYFQGKEITHLPVYKMASLGISRSFQLLNVFSELTVFENIRMGIQAHLGHGYQFFTRLDGLKEIRDRVPAIIERVGLEGKETARAKDLSYGDNKILDMAIALTADPTVLLLDEPTSGLALKETGRMIDLIRKLSEKLTILLVEHDMNVVFSVSQRIVVMSQGRIIAEGKPEEIRRNETVQEAYLGGEWKC